MYAGRLWPRTNQITRPWAIGDGYIGQKKLTIEQSIVRIKSYHAGCSGVNERLLYLAPARGNSTPAHGAGPSVNETLLHLAPARGATTFLTVLFLTWFLLMEAQKG
jgi:hypothetical protein